MERAREHANEFKNTTKFVKLLFDSTNSFTRGIRDFQTFYRLMRIALKIKEYDKVSRLGERLSLIGLADSDAKKMLQGFEFNADTLLTQFIPISIVVDEHTNSVRVPRLCIEVNLVKQSGSSRFLVQFARVSMNRQTGKCSVECLTPQEGALDNLPSDMVFGFDLLPDESCFRFYLCKVMLLIETNHEMYKSKLGSACAIVAVK